MPMADGRLPQVLVTRATTISTTTMQKIVDSESLQRHSCDIFVSFSIRMKCVGFVLFDQRMNKS